MIVLVIIDYILYFIFSLMVLYLVVFGIASLCKRKTKCKETQTQSRIVVLFPAYAEDRIIVSTVSSFLEQDYPSELYDVVVISDHMEDETNDRLRQLPIELLVAGYTDSSKAKALNLAIDHLKGRTYDALVIMDADNVVDSNFLSEINKAYNSGISAMQAHRVSKNINTEVALLDAISEEINNSFFRLGNVALGLSASLSGSGMAFDYNLFRDKVKFLKTAGEDRELEALLLKERVYVGYLPEVLVYDEKIQSVHGFKNQRKRWVSAQLITLAASIKDMPTAISQRNLDYFNKLVQWMLLPRSIMILILPFIALFTTFWGWTVAMKWWILTFVFYLIMMLMVPRYLVDKRLFKAVLKVPVMAFHMFLNFFKLKEGKKFIHTDHGETEER